MAQAFRRIVALQKRLSAEAASIPRVSALRLPYEPPENLLGYPRRRAVKAVVEAPDPEDNIEGIPLNQVVGRICVDLIEAARLMRDPATMRKVMAIVEAMGPMLRKIAAPVAAVVAAAVTPAAALAVGAPDTG